MRFIIVFFLFLLFGSVGISQEIVTDRPDQTESSSTLGKADLQLETGMFFMEADHGKIDYFGGPSTLIRIGLFQGFELRVVTQYEDLKLKGMDGNDVKGWSDLQLGAKIQLLQNEGNTEIAFLSHVVLPTAKAELTNDELGMINKLAISHDLGEKIGLGYNIGYDYMGSTHQLTYSLAFGILLTQNLGIFLEPYGTFSEGGSFESNFDTGITYLLNPMLQLDASYGFGINHSMKFIGFGISWKLPGIFRSSK